jgi:nucleoside phosphorylase
MKVDIAIITIRDDELRAVRNRLQVYRLPEQQEGPSGRTFLYFSVPTRVGRNCIVALYRAYSQGNDISQQVATDMIAELSPQIILVVGIAGGLPDTEYTLGDVIVSSYIHNLNVSANTGEISFDDHGGIHPLVGELASNIVQNEQWLDGWNTQESIGRVRPTVDLAWAREPENTYGSEKWRQKVLRSLTAQFGESPIREQIPLFKTGSIASSNILVKDAELVALWQTNARNILAVEMEAAGAHRAAQRIHGQYPVMTIRGLSDIVGLERDQLYWKLYAAETAGAFTCAFIKAAFVKPRESANPPTSSTTSIQGSVQPPHPQPRSTIDPSTSANGAQDRNKPVPFDVFIAYAKEDEKLKKELETHLATLKREKVIQPWHSEQTGAGLDWEQEIRSHLDQSQIILLLISPSFLASDSLYESMEYAMQRHKEDTARVIPILIRPADIGASPFKDLQGLPRDRRPVDTVSNRDQAWVDIVKDLRRVCNELRERQKSSVE